MYFDTGMSEEGVESRNESPLKRRKSGKYYAATSSFHSHLFGLESCGKAYDLRFLV